MADLFPQLNGERATKATITLPYRGIWTVDVALDQQVAVTSGVATVGLGGLSLAGTIFRAGDFEGTGIFRVVGGFGGWQKQLPAKFYRGAGSSGLKLSAVLGDTARTVGEKISIDSDVSVGACFARSIGPAARVLNSLAGQWWVRPDGTTQVGQRPNPIISSQFDVIPGGTNLGIGRIVIATDTPEDWVPGAQFSSSSITLRTISTVVHHLSPNKVRTVVWTN